MLEDLGITCQNLSSTTNLFPPNCPSSAIKRHNEPIYIKFNFFFAYTNYWLTSDHEQHRVYTTSERNFHRNDVKSPTVYTLGAFLNTHIKSLVDSLVGDAFFMLQTASSVATTWNRNALWEKTNVSPVDVQQGERVYDCVTWLARGISELRFDLI